MSGSEAGDDQVVILAKLDETQKKRLKRLLLLGTFL
jgi:hypothetical protein